MLRNERPSRGRRLIGVLVCIVLGVSLGVWHNRAVRRGRTDFITASVRTVSAPFVGILTGSNRWTGRQIGWLFHGRTLAGENTRLLAENARLREQNAKLVEADIDLQRLRKEMGFQQAAEAPKLAADVISLRPDLHNETVTIARGSRGGVRPQAVVVTPYGLVGRVSDVAPGTSGVMLLTDSNSSVGAMIQRADSRATGVCRGNGSPFLSMLYVARDANVRPGDVVVSSGLGGDKGVFPKGLVIGTVATVRNDASGSSRVVSVKPAVDFSRLEEVFVIP